MPADAWSMLDTCLTLAFGFLLGRSSVDGVVEVRPAPREAFDEDTGVGSLEHLQYLAEEASQHPGAGVVVGASGIQLLRWLSGMVSCGQQGQRAIRRNFGCGPRPRQGALADFSDAPGWSHEHVLGWPVRFDPGHESWVIETADGHRYEELLSGWDSVIDLTCAYPSTLDGKVVQLEDILVGPAMEAVIQGCREEALKLRTRVQVACGAWQRIRGQNDSSCGLERCPDRDQSSHWAHQDQSPSLRADSARASSGSSFSCWCRFG